MLCSRLRRYALPSLFAIPNVGIIPGRLAAIVPIAGLYRCSLLRLPVLLDVGHRGWRFHNHGLISVIGIVRVGVIAPAGIKSRPRIDGHADADISMKVARMSLN